MNRLPTPATRLQLQACTFVHYYPGATLAQIAQGLAISAPAALNVAGMLAADGYLTSHERWGHATYSATGAWSPEDAEAPAARFLR